MAEQTDAALLRQIAAWCELPANHYYRPLTDQGCAGLRALADRLEAESETIGWGMANLGERITGHPMYEPDEQGREAATHHVQTLNAHEETAHWVVVRVVRND